MPELSPFGVRASAGTLRDGDGIVLPHAWTADGVVAGPASNVAVALCVLNDTYREARRLGIDVSGVAVTADGGFADDWRSTGITYTITVDSSAAPVEVERLFAAVDEVAEIPKALRTGASVARVAT